MKLLHEKSKCCSAKIIRFGGKRRQCATCKKTWRVHPAKRGPKSPRKQYNYLHKVINQGFTVKQLSLKNRISINAVYKRFSKNLDAFVAKKRVIRIKGSKLILLVDAQWHYFDGDLWTLYFLAVKPVDSHVAIVLDPIMKQGKENATTWSDTFSMLPPSIKRRVIAVVSDGLRGIQTVIERNGWIIQRCHFHLLSALQKRRGKRSATPGRLIREEIYQIAKQIITEKSNRKLNVLCKRLAVLSQHELCPVAMKKIARDLLRRLPEFRSYIDYPDLKIPTTVNVMESINSYIRKKTKTLNNPESWCKWAVASIRLKSKFTCK
jgi:hypothetical protein